MSLRYEQYRSLWETKKLLQRLLHNKYLAQDARHCLRHFPFLASNGEPLFSNDEFDCPDLKEEK